MSKEGEPFQQPDSCENQGNQVNPNRVKDYTVFKLNNHHFSLAELGCYIVGGNLLMLSIFPSEDIQNKLPIYGIVSIFVGLTDHRFRRRHKP